VASGRSPLLLTERTDHLDDFAVRLREKVQHLIILRGGMGAKQRREVADALAAIPEDEERVLLATGRYIGEGFDDARLDTLFLAMPVSWRGTLQQYVGRLHRLHDSKREVQVYDYVDGVSPLFTAMFQKRLKGYEAVGYEVLEDWENLPASFCLPTANVTHSSARKS
jgi:superfamily II DNA or RNA helicase